MSNTDYGLRSTECDAERPDSTVLADRAGGWRSAYVHIPFCARRCPYCDFAVVAADEPGGGEVERYVDALVAEVGMEPQPFRVDAVNFGGGTPTRVPPSHLGRILEVIDARLGTTTGAEISIEANPEDWTDDRARELKSIGFNRVSFGVQSLDPFVLHALGRAHSPEDSTRAVVGARSAGFDTVSVDVIYGTPGESEASWCRTVDGVLDLEPNHVSAYALTVEGGTALSRSIQAGAPAPDPDEQADRFEYVDSAAREAGLIRYEVSNWAEAGHACRYNLSTWMMGEYAAFGTGAHDHRFGVRSRNIRRLDAYLARIDAGERARSGSERLDAFESERQRFMVGLRLVCGVEPGSVGGPFLDSVQGRRLAGAGVVGLRDGRVVVLRPLLTDLVARSVLSV
ncbi:MAG: radical SAM family heme chaperone HemW, partial [Acidimicrobiia bacterium]